MAPTSHHGDRVLSVGSLRYGQRTLGTPLTVPAKVRIDAAGYAVSATGRVLTDHNGRPSRSTTHPKAVQRLGL